MTYDQVTKRILLHHEGTLIASTDMGESWSYTPMPVFITKEKIPFPYVKGADSMIITNRWGGIFVTIDGGKTIEQRTKGIETPWGPAQH